MNFKPLVKVVIIAMFVFIKEDIYSQATWNFTAATASGALPANITTLSSVTRVNNNGTTTLIAAGAPASSTAFYAGASGGNNGNSSARTGVINTATSTYIQVVLTPAANHWVNITAIQWGNFSLSATGPTTLSIYTSINNYATPLATATVGYSTTNWTLVSPSFTPISGLTGTAVTVRIYASGGTGTTPAAGAVNWRVDDLRITATGQAGAVGRIPKYSSNNTFTNSNITELNGNIGIGTTSPDSSLTVNNGIWGKGGARLSGLPVSNNASDSMVVITTTGAGIGTLGLRKIPSVGSTGTVTSINAGYGITGGTITTTGTHGVDTNIIATRAWRQKGIDSVQDNINLLQTTLNGKVNITDTAVMLFPYARKDFFSSGFGINYNSANGTLTNTAPDQMVSLTPGAGIGVSGAYPNFTITNNSPGTAGNFIQNATVLQPSSNFWISGNGVANGNISGNRIIASEANNFTIGNPGIGSGIAADNDNIAFRLSNSAASKNFYFQTWGGSGTLMTLTDAGSLGIGTGGSPTYKLDVNGGIRFTNNMSSNNFTWNGDNGFGVWGNNGLPLFNTAYGFVNSWSTSADVMAIRGITGQTGDYLNVINPAGSKLFTINSGGNIGIGTSSPSSLLHTNGSLRFEGLTNNNSLNRVLAADSNGNISWKDASSISANSWGLTGNAGTLASNFLGTSDNSPLRFRTNNLERMVLDSNGNLAANGDIKSKTINLTQWGTWGSIRNLTPTNGLELVSNGMMIFRAANGARNAYLKPDGDFLLVGGSGEELAGIGTNNGSNNLIFKANGSPGVPSVERMRLTAEGNVGIGTNNPLAQLHTSGTVRFDNYKNNAAGDSVLTTDANGNLKLKLITALPIGWGLAGNSGTNPTTNFIGTTDNVDIVFKRNSVKSGLISADNVAFGTNSLLNNTTGSYNVALGVNSLMANTGGYYNNAIGRATLQANTSGYNNVAIGDGALFTNTNGHTNVGVGSYSLLSNTIGISNTALGTQSLTANISGNYNLGLGRYALNASTTGSDNVAAGLQAMYSNISGSNNVAMGNYSLFSNNSGSNNVSIGYRSNVGSGNLANATAIGSQAYVTQSNSMVLGSIAGVNGAPASTNVGIGVTDPSALLHTNGSLRFDGLVNDNALSRILATDSAGNIFWKDASTQGANLTFSDGLTRNGNNIKLGGLTNQDGEIDFIGPIDTAWQAKIKWVNGTLGMESRDTSDVSNQQVVYVSPEERSVVLQSIKSNTNTVAALSPGLLELNVIKGANRNSLTIDTNYINLSRFKNTATLDSLLTTDSLGNLKLVKLNISSSVDNSKWILSNTTIHNIDSLNVGIGTDSALAKLHINGNVLLEGYKNNAQIDSVLTTDSAGYLKLVKLNIPSAADNSKWVLRNTTIHNVDSLNVGIGTDSALAKLHINGDVLLESYRNNPQIDSVLTTNDEGKLIMVYRPFGGGGGGTVYNFLNGVQQLNGNVSFGGLLQDSVKLNTNNNNFSINNGTQKLFHINGNNNIGLGTATPAARLDIQQLTAADIAYDAIRIHKSVDSVKSWVSFTQGTGAGSTAFRLGQIGQFSGLGLYKGSNNPSAPGQLVQKWDINGYTGINTGETTGELSVGSVHGNKLSIGNSQWAQPHIINTGTHATYGDYTDMKVPGALFNNALIRLNKSGNVGIGTTNIDTLYRLSVNGKIRAKGLKVESGNWADFVFEPGYKLRSLAEVENFIKTNKHLPEVPTSEQVKKDGTDVGEIQALLLQKIEELTLYVIDQDKKVKELEEQNKTLQKQAGEIDGIKKQLEELKKLVLNKK